MIRYCPQILTIGLLLLLLQTPGPAQAHPPQQDRIIIPFSAVTARLDSDDLLHEWRFTGQQDQLISITAQQRSGDLDVVLELATADGQLLAANDNATFDTTDARLEAIRLPNDDDYVIRVYREGLETGISCGVYELQLLIGYSSLSADVPAATTTEDTAQRTISFNSTHFFITANTRLPMDAGTYALEWRIIDPTTITWVFQHRADGGWRLSITNARGQILRSTEGNNNLLLAQEDGVPLRLWRGTEGLQVFVEETRIAQIAPVENLMPTQPGQLRVAPTSPDGPLTLIDDYHLTTAFYTADPFTMGAIPPTATGRRIYDYTASPATIVERLRELDYAPPATATSGLQGNIINSFILNDAASFNAYPLIERPFQDFVLSFSARLTGGTEGSACGVIFRQVSPETFATLLFTPTRGLYVLQYENGELQDGGIVKFTETLLPGNAANNHFIIVANAGTGAVFVNGRLVTEVPLNETAGFTLSHLALDADLPTYCQLDNLWLWSLE